MNIFAGKQPKFHGIWIRDTYFNDQHFFVCKTFSEYFENVHKISLTPLMTLNTGRQCVSLYMNIGPDVRFSRTLMYNKDHVSILHSVYY